MSSQEDYQRGYARALALYNNSGITVIHPYGIKAGWWVEHNGKGEAVMGKRAAKKLFQEFIGKVAKR
jgi:hypothetical protein